MKLTQQQIAAINQFGVNAWYVRELIESGHLLSNDIPESWKALWRDWGLDVADWKNTTASHPVITQTAGATPTGVTDQYIPIQGGALKIAENMQESLAVPVATSHRTVPVKLLEENRRRINQYLKKESIKVSYTHLLAWAVVRALKKHPVMNGAYAVKDHQPHWIKRGAVHLGIAVDIERKDGSRSLIVPNIKNADTMDFRRFILAYHAIVAKTRSGRIEPADFTGTTISLTNPGGLGTVTSNPRLMVGQGAIIAAGAVGYPAEFHGMAEETLSALGISKVVNLTSTYDHRIIQGAESGAFLKTIHEQLTGEHGFYETIFRDLGIPAKPLAWQQDTPVLAFSNISDSTHLQKQIRIPELINMYRVRGHHLADLDPLAVVAHDHPELDPGRYGFTLWDYDRVFLTGGLAGKNQATLREILDILTETYAEKIGVEFRHIQSPEEKEWLQNRMESARNRPAWDAATKQRILQQLIIAEAFEKFIHTKFVGHKRFSLEGSDTLIPLLDHLLYIAADAGVKEVVFGMSHRGRLNVLANIIGKWYAKIFSEFEGNMDPDSIQGSGDVKYHLGATGIFNTRNGQSVQVSIAPNPSHLEWVNAVVEGIVRAKQSRKPAAVLNKSYLALLIHGDAAFAGQGVVAETLNLSQLKGYRTRGTFHIILNNQIGFTTLPEEARSSPYATDVARMIQAPIFHVNGDDPEAALWVAQLAFEFRQRFEKDVVIDLIGYRRHGHNESDEPGYTQPLMYRKIRSHPTVKTIYAERLIQEKLLPPEQITEFENGVYQCLNESLDAAKAGAVKYEPDVPLAVPVDALRHPDKECITCVTADTLLKLIDDLTKVPDTFRIHPKLQTFLDVRRQTMATRTGIDWAFAESLAFGSLLLEGVPVRLSGEDSRRGTFSQRHLALTDIETEAEFVPLNAIPGAGAKIEAIDSLLSEAAVLGFEYGYSLADPLALVLWEAQFGDFVNVAQPVIDNFIASARSKWQLNCHLVLLLPHGLEGQGAEHSSARLERFLQLAAEDNIYVCNLTTPAQYFHVLRRQIYGGRPRPLILMTPKSLLRLPEARSDLSAFTDDRFHEVLDDEWPDKHHIRRLIFCSGKIYYELKSHREKNRLSQTAIIRLEQLYPFPSEAVAGILKSYPANTDIYWVQEEPKNMGAWRFIQPLMNPLLTFGQTLFYVGRDESAAPAEGSFKIFRIEQDRIIREAFS